MQSIVPRESRDLTTSKRSFGGLRMTCRCKSDHRVGPPGLEYLLHHVRAKSFLASGGRADF
jgi:hypothetical protein